MNTSKISLAFWFGTEAELLKTFPVILELKKQSLDPYIIATGQNNLLESTIVNEYSLAPDLTLNQFHWRKLPRNVIVWYFWTFVSCFWKTWRYLRKNKIQYLIVHGDTLSTLMGAIIGRLAGVQVWHLEAGLRTFQWLTPFPEEIDRYIVGKLSSVHFCQNQEAMTNVKNHKGVKIFTQGNVIYDVVDSYIERGSDVLKEIKKPFSVITFHRAESLYLGDNFQLFIDTLFRSADTLPTLFVMFEATREMIEKTPGLMQKIQNHPGIIIKPRLPYGDFCFLMKEASYLITDGGSNQEELAHIGTPTLIMRKATERSDGIGKNIVLSMLDKNIIQDFFQKYPEYDHKGEEQGSPTRIVAEYTTKVLKGNKNHE